MFNEIQIIWNETPINADKTIRLRTTEGFSGFIA